MKVSEYFVSIQGEGHYSGRAACFVRLYGCNLSCDYCDEPLHRLSYQDMTLDNLCDKLNALGPKFTVITGGEPSLYDCSGLIRNLQERGHFVAVETNGYKPENIKQANWITYSPKDLVEVDLSFSFNELKLLINPDTDPSLVSALADQTGALVYIQPQNEIEEINWENLALCLNMIKQDPRLRLSVQLHKILKIQ